MDKLVVNPGRCRVHGNIISYKYGYMESKNEFKSHQSEISLNPVENNAYDDFNVYSFHIAMNPQINRFNDNIAYCRSANINEIGSWLYVCEHFNTTFDPINSIATINTFNNGYKITIKDEYLINNQDNTAPFFLLIHQDGTGVSIPNNVDNISFSSNYKASPNIGSIKVGFVFFDENNNFITAQELADIANIGTGNTGRCNVSTYSIPSNAKYVSVEFSFPNGVGRYINREGQSVNDFFSMELNCLLFNNRTSYGGFVKND